MAPIEVMREIRAASLRRLDDLNAAIHLAWQVQNVKVHTKRSKSGKVTLPNLEKLQITEAAWTRTKKPKQTSDQMKAVLQTLSFRSGIPLRKAKPRGQ